MAKNKVSYRVFKAFSLVELIVVMLLTTVVVSLSYLVFDVISSSLFTFRADQYTIQEYQSFNSTLFEDVNTCQRLVSSREGVKCEFESKEVIYQFYQDYVLRKQEEWLDTIHVSVTSFQGSWQGKSVTNEKELLDELVVETVCREEQIPIVLLKQYGADQLMAKLEVDEH